MADDCGQNTNDRQKVITIAHPELSSGKLNTIIAAISGIIFTNFKLLVPQMTYATGVQSTSQRNFVLNTV